MKKPKLDFAAIEAAVRPHFPKIARELYPGGVMCNGIYTAKDVHSKGIICINMETTEFAVYPNIPWKIWLAQRAELS